MALPCPKSMASMQIGKELVPQRIPAHLGLAHQLGPVRNAYRRRQWRRYFINQPLVKPIALPFLQPLMAGGVRSPMAVLWSPDSWKWSLAEWRAWRKMTGH